MHITLRFDIWYSLISTLKYTHLGSCKNVVHCQWSYATLQMKHMNTQVSNLEFHVINDHTLLELKHINMMLNSIDGMNMWWLRVHTCSSSHKRLRCCSIAGKAHHNNEVLQKKFNVSVSGTSITFKYLNLQSKISPWVRDILNFIRVTITEIPYHPTFCG